MQPTNKRERQTILLVECDPDDEMMTLRALEKANIKNEVLVARDGAEALNHLFATSATRDAGAMPQIILLEPKLPKVEGLEILQRLRADERTRDLPVAVFVSSDEEQDLMDRHGMGSNVYIRKPVDFAQFSRAVQRLGLSWRIFKG